MQEITVGDREKVVRSVAQGAIAAFGSIISMFLGISLVFKEVERKTVYTILSRPRQNGVDSLPLHLFEHQADAQEHGNDGTECSDGTLSNTPDNFLSVSHSDFLHHQAQSDDSYPKEQNGVEHPIPNGFAKPFGIGCSTPFCSLG